MQETAIPSSLIGAITFFLLLAIVAMAVIRETVKIILKPALVIVVLALLAVWAGVLDETVVGDAFAWIGNRLILGIQTVSDWVAGAWAAQAPNG